MRIILMIPLIFLFVSNAAHALNGGHWVLGSDANTGTQILGVSHTGDVASGMPDVDDVVVLRAPEIFDWDAECLKLSGQLTYKGAHIVPGWGYYISLWYIDASNIINSEKNDTSAGSASNPVENNDWSMLGNLTLTNKCDSRKHYDIERNLDVGGNYQAIIVKGSVGAKASCTLSLSSPTVDLGEINASDLLSLSPGTNVKGKDGSVEVTTKCNQSAYTLTFKPEKIAASCIGMLCCTMAIFSCGVRRLRCSAPVNTSTILFS